jgi:hypothetical protein
MYNYTFIINLARKHLIESKFPNIKELLQILQKVNTDMIRRCSRLMVMTYCQQ